MSASKSIKTEHAGAKNGGGYWGKRDEAKLLSRKLRRQRDHQAVAEVEIHPSPDSLQA